MGGGVALALPVFGPALAEPVAPFESTISGGTGFASAEARSVVEARGAIVHGPSQDGSSCPRAGSSA